MLSEHLKLELFIYIVCRDSIHTSAKVEGHFGIQMSLSFVRDTSFKLKTGFNLVILLHNSRLNFLPSENRALISECSFKNKIDVFRKGKVSLHW